MSAVPSPSSISVSQVVRRARSVLEGQFSGLWVRGEISNLTRQASGHIYFTLKDADAQLSCVMFRGHTAKISGKLAAGVQMEAFGSLSVFEGRGSMQLLVTQLRAMGLGALQEAFLALKAKLQAEGLFDPERKKCLPSFPRTVCLITSPTGAAVQDMLHVLGRRAPWLRVLLFPVKVQGAGAAEEIAAALDTLSAAAREGTLSIDAVIVGRGGGSVEDLWAFNEEILARAVARFPLPIISAVGHEVDFTICDFVADMRAPTPSAAAEILTPDGDELRRRLQATRNTLETMVSRYISRRKERLALLETGALHRVPARILADAQQRCDLAAEDLKNLFAARQQRSTAHLERLSALLQSRRPDAVLARRQERLLMLKQRLDQRISQIMATRQQHVQGLSRLLGSLGPNAVLSRGYSLTRTRGGLPVRSAAALAVGEEILTSFADGVAVSVVERIVPPSSPDSA